MAWHALSDGFFGSVRIVRLGYRYLYGFEDGMESRQS